MAVQLPDDTMAPATAVQALIGARELRALYQPIVRLDDRRTVAFEALARGPAHSPLERPDRLFAAARAAGVVSELDWACQRVALEGALGARTSGTLFVNVEPVSLGRPLPEGLAVLAAAVGEQRGLVLEITERAITARPAEVLGAVRRARAAGFGIAVDDIGADPRSLALLPFLAPDVIKLDLRLIQDRPDRDVAATMTAVLAAAERSGAEVLAEGIETEEHLRTALGLGAALGQGWYFGRPGPLGTGAGRLALARRAPRALAETPFAAVAACRRTRRTSKRLLIEISKHLEEQAAQLSPPGVLLAAFQEAENFTAATGRRYTRLAGRASLTAAFGWQMPPEPRPGVRGAELGAEDPLRAEWSVTVVGPHYAAALVAREAPAGGTGDLARAFDYVVTHERDLVVRAAESLLARIAPESDGAVELAAALARSVRTGR